MDRKPDDILRLFFGVLLPPDVQEEMAALQQRLAASGVRVKWVEPHNLHVTLKFLGEMQALVLRDLKLIGHKLAAEMPPWTARLQGLGAFPKLARPQTLWVGLGEGEEPMAHLGKRLNQKLEHEMIAAMDAKPFRPHCTLGRVKQETRLRGLIDLVHRETEFASQPFRCDHFELMCSTLSAAGPTYEVLAEFGLGTRG